RSMRRGSQLPTKKCRSGCRMPVTRLRESSRSGGKAAMDRQDISLEESRMNKKIKVRCNGQERHINEIDLDRLLKPSFVVRGDNMVIDFDGVEFPLYEDCRYCAGHVIITREVVEKSC